MLEGKQTYHFLNCSKIYCWKLNKLNKLLKMLNYNTHTIDNNNNLSRPLGPYYSEFSRLFSSIISKYQRIRFGRYLNTELYNVLRFTYYSIVNWRVEKPQDLNCG